MQTELSAVGETVTGHELDARLELALFMDSQDLAHILEEVDQDALTRADVCREDVTLLLLGPEGELWATETRYPGSLQAVYTRLR